MRHNIFNFLHIFSGGGYASAYYSYIWSEVMDADVFQAFREENDLFSKKLASKLEKYILATGGSEDPDKLYIDFRGRLPKIDSLLQERGLNSWVV